jgi:transcriptional regulator with XRE-family HTH domain
LYLSVLKCSFVVEKNIDLEVGDKIKAYRTLKGLSQKEVAITIGADQGQYSRIESGKVEPTLPSLRKIADALGVSLADLFTEEKPVDVNSFDKDLIEQLKLLAELDPDERKSICHIIDIAINKKRLKDSLSNALGIK